MEAASVLRAPVTVASLRPQVDLAASIPRLRWRFLLPFDSLFQRAICYQARLLKGFFLLSFPNYFGGKPVRHPQCLGGNLCQMPPLRMGYSLYKEFSRHYCRSSSILLLKLQSLFPHYPESLSKTYLTSFLSVCLVNHYIPLPTRSRRRERNLDTSN